MTDYFKNIVAAKRSNDEESAIGWGQTDSSVSNLAATNIGSARKAKREAKISESDLVEKRGTDINCTVVSVTPGNGAWSSFKLGVVVNNVEVDDKSVNTFRLPSGAFYQIASKKLDKSRAGGEKIAMPHIFPDACVAVRIDGIIVVDVKGMKNGPNETELKESDITIGTTLTLKDLVFDYHHTAATKEYPERHAAFASCKSIDYGSNYVKGPTHPREATAKIFEALSFTSNGAHAQVIDIVNDHVGFRPAALLEAANADKAALALKMEDVLNRSSDAKVGINQPWEESLFSEEAKSSWIETIAALKSGDVESLNVLRSFPKSAMLRSHNFPIVQFPIDPATAALTDRKNTGVSFNIGIATAPDICDLEDSSNPFVANDVHKFAEVTLSIASDKALRAPPTEADPEPLGLTKEDIATKSMGSIAIDVSSFAYAIRDRDGGGFVPTLLKTEDGTSVVIKQFLDSCKKCNIVNAFGIYDFYRTWMLVNELIPYLPTVLFFSDWDNEKTVESITVQPKCENGWAQDIIPNVYDVATAVSSVGVQVTKDFLTEFAVDDENYLSTPARPIQYVAEDSKNKKDSNKKQLPPAPAKLDRDGYVCLNGLPETSINRVKKIPEGSDGYKLFVVYEGCAKDVLECVKINQDPNSGSEFLKSKFNDDLKAKLANVSCIYCIANAPEANSSNKKQKTA